MTLIERGGGPTQHGAAGGGAGRSTQARAGRHAPGKHGRGVAARGVVAALETAFNLLVLNLAILVGTAGIVTLPATIVAATAALERWRVDGEDRVLQEFVRALRRCRPLRTTVVVGVPVLAGVVAAEEVHFFVTRAGLAAHLCLGLGISALFVSATSIGYVFLLAGRHPSAKVLELWSVCARLAVRNMVRTGPLFVVEIAVAAFLILFDTPLVLVGVPVVTLQVMRVTARAGLARSVAA